MLFSCDAERRSRSYNQSGLGVDLAVVDARYFLEFMREKISMCPLIGTHDEDAGGHDNGGTQPH